MEPIWVLLLLLELDTVQVTPVLVEPDTVAVNWKVAPKPTLAVPGEMVTLTFVEGGGVVLLLPPPPHPAPLNVSIMTAARKRRLAYLMRTPDVLP